MSTLRKPGQPFQQTTTTEPQDGGMGSSPLDLPSYDVAFWVARHDLVDAQRMQAEARAAAAEAVIASLQADLEAAIYLLWSDVVFVGSEWKQFPDESKGVLPCLCARTSTVARELDAEPIPQDQWRTLAALMREHGQGAVAGWVRWRRQPGMPASDDLSPEGRAALAALTANGGRVRAH